MFAFLGRLASRRPWWIIAAWIVFAVAVIAFAPKLTATQDQSDFLPEHYESIQAADLQSEAFPEATQVGAIIVFSREDGEPLTDDDSAEIEKVVTGLNGDLAPAFVGAQVQPPSENKLVQIAGVGLAEDATGFDTQSMDAVEDLRTDLSNALDGSEVQYGVTGGAAQSLDSQDASEQALEIVGIATVVLIVVLLSIIFRSVIIALMPIVVVGLVSSGRDRPDRDRQQGLRPQGRQLDPGRSWWWCSSASAPTTSSSSSSATASGCARARRPGRPWCTRSSGPARRSRPPVARSSSPSWPWCSPRWASSARSARRWRSRWP